MLKRIFTAVIAVCTMVSYLPAQQVDTPGTVKVERNTLLQFALMQPLDPATSRPGHDVPLRLTRQLTAGGLVVLPVGSVVHGKITKVTPAGRYCANGAVKWKIETIPLPDGSVLKTEVWNSSRSTTRASGPSQHHSSGEIVGYVIQDAVLLPLVVPGMAIYETRKVVTAPFRHGSCSRWHDRPLPANASVGIRIREDHQVRVMNPTSR